MSTFDIYFYSLIRRIITANIVVAIVYRNGMQMRYTDPCTTAGVSIIYEKRLFAVLINFIF